MTSFNSILAKYRKLSFSERDKGDRFETLIQNYFLTDPKYSYNLKKVWLWNEFPSKTDFGGKDIGIDLVALTINDEYWAIQCKCFDENATIDKKAVDSFLSTSSKTFKNEQLQTVGFSQRLWVSTTNKWGSNAEETIKNQNPPVTRINLSDLQQAPVDWGKIEDGISGGLARNEKKFLRLHQTNALEKTNEYLKEHDRGKLIMACGTGKTFTSLRIAENETNGKGLVLFLVPSIALLGQTLREWTANALEPITSICICSDTKITKQKTNDDLGDTSLVDLPLPATTDVKSVIKQFKNINRTNNTGMTVVFSTYQSIEVIATAQQNLLKEGNENAVFDLIICDEAHRTTGVSLTKEDSSSFIKVHDNDFIKAQKRLYMTATPRLYSEDSISKAQQNDAIICSMDDVNTYGEEIYRIGFGEAVEKDLLTDYKVLILTLNEKDIPASVQSMIAGSDNEISSDDASKLIGCINALSKQVLGDEGLLKGSDPEPMKRAVAFCQNIKVSNHITNTLNQTKGIYLDSLTAEAREKMVNVSSKHIDGSMNAPTREELLEWLKSSDTEPNECRILTNVRCLSEGVDVPSLDAVLFLSARNSQVDVVQSVGRVMRKAEGKKYGYIIIPVVVPSDVDATKALDNNDRFKVVWAVLNALRAHDDRFNATINKIDLNKKKPNQILVGGASHGNDDETSESNGTTKDVTEQLALQFQELQGIMYAKMVQKVGDRVYWEKWAKDVAKIAEDQISRIKHLINTQPEHKEAFDKFLQGLQKNINPSISEAQAIEMLSQHIITKPVFEALFEGYSFVKNNAISTSMQAMLDVLESTTSQQDFEVLENFYQSVKKRASGIDNAEGKQKIIIELYDKFFKTAFPKMVEQLGIVYTPVEVVDFIIHSVNDVLKSEFGRSVSDENIHILDPFTGTGTFIVRLLQSGLITQEDLHRKYTKELHANEIVLLAYYIAAVNIENAFHDATEDPEDGIGKEKYIPFDGIVLTDTFQLGETDATEKLFSEMFPQNSERVQKQKSAPIRVIIGNPPYSIGQKSANDNAQNQKYEKLDKRIESSYAKASNAGLNKSLYDAYIKAFRWSTDRLDPKNGGIIAFVSNGAWLDGNSTDGFRKELEKEFSSIYVFNLRGNQRTKGELSRKEGGKIFGSGSRTPISITLLVKSPEHKGKATIHYHDIGDYLTREEKLKIIKDFKTVSNLPTITLQPNAEGDWINQRNSVFEEFIPIEPENKFDLKAQSFFNTYAIGVGTNRDPWAYNYSKIALIENMTKMIEFYNSQIVDLKGNILDIETDSSKISWSANLKKDFISNKLHNFDINAIKESSYRPFCKQNLYFDRPFIERPGINAQFYTNTNDSSNNITICISPSANDGISLLISNNLTNLHFNGDTQCFPLYYYEENKFQQRGLFDEDNTNQYIRRDGVSDFILTRATKQYGNTVSKEDIFYYVYGILHSPDYRETFANDLKKMLPRIPLVEEPRDFWKFSKAGRALAELHLNYESIEPYKGVMVLYNTIPQEKLEQGSQGKELEADYKVQKMRFPKKEEKNSIIYNSQITIDNIPEKAYKYVVNGKSAIEWIMEKYQITIDAKSGLTNNPNDWAEETGNPKYILNLLLSIINVSVQTVDIVEDLPKLNLNTQ
ncbi:helicase [Elizabethkingia anophelis]|uniref:DEAD/DEAH box helicase n=1 Tax=Elizabethkingia TaxID=308865 RepID=UPI0004638077|nr:type ISP restriction/modification enzyme [Elizabethkingia anophelis]MDV3751039.1 helicase [Elizabethkingia anophelis]HAT3992465.1 DEAD/DEAH box helicase [Elizabethkingia anophelis]HAT3995097.1 DEAD/DEAH box helicase [Elizabethkingia anophelis]HAT4002813.1 DEAD/DEAH box helicase [Elizabethkingia anophelis]